jgi:hypothetical protein
MNNATIPLRWMGTFQTRQNLQTKTTKTCAKQNVMGIHRATEHSAG